jgi:hypothetical protein
MWAGVMWADNIEIISILGESLIVFCVVFVSVVGVIKLAERSVDLAGSPVLGGRETGKMRDTRERGPVAPKRLAARRPGPHDERSPPASRASPESHGKSREGSTSGMRRSLSFDGAIDNTMHSRSLGSAGGMRRSSSSDTMRTAGETILRRNKSYGASLDCSVEASADAQHLAATGARRPGSRDERSPTARARPESHGKPREGSTSGMPRSLSFDGEFSAGGSRVPHSSSSDTMCSTAETILRRNKSFGASLDCFAGASPDA